MVTCGRPGQPYERQEVPNQAPIVVAALPLLDHVFSTHYSRDFSNTGKTRMGPTKECPHGPT